MRINVILMFIGMIILVGCSNSKTEVNFNDPEQVMIHYAHAIANKDIRMLVRLYGGEYDWISGFSPEKDRENKEVIFKNYLEVIPEKIRFHEILKSEKINEEEYIFTITFQKEDGTLFDVGDTQSRSNEFRYRIMKVNEQFMVMDPPPYQA